MGRGEDYGVVRANQDSDDESISSMECQDLYKEPPEKKMKSRRGTFFAAALLTFFCWVALLSLSAKNGSTEEVIAAAEKDSANSAAGTTFASVTDAPQDSKPPTQEPAVVVSEPVSEQEGHATVVASTNPKNIFTVVDSYGTRTCPSENRFWSDFAPKPRRCFNFSILLLKGQKTGSSTSGGVARRIAARMGLNCVGCGSASVWKDEPSVIAPHIFNAVKKMDMYHRKLKTFTFGFIRDPISRCLSQFYHFRVSRGGTKPTPAHIIANGNKTVNYLTRYYGLDEYRDRIDFLGVTNRYQESMLVVGYKLGATMGDILYTKAKDSSKGVKDVTGHKKTNLAKHVPISEQPKEVQDYFYGEFLERNYKDTKYFEEAQQELDDTIEVIGRERFEQKLAEYKHHLKIIDTECDSYISTTGAMKPGIKCYYRDNGCNYRCFDEYAARNNLWDDALEL
eukprot:CAMPEP_0184507506 /NCGR_PEP_ID=MMETSP0198_2-20121128/276_1 /TAXON_ID=1112570 /ORGANISM="Thraustochytrium sp., Strain LLF1b" /LENGTH=451 /DNA_ID=CAMNT_0026897253 /DNA_START=199 /DNA_END=1554 /DNA_ORIENTATION=-